MARTPCELSVAPVTVAVHPWTADGPVRPDLKCQCHRCSSERYKALTIEHIVDRGTPPAPRARHKV